VTQSADKLTLPLAKIVPQIKKQFKVLLDIKENGETFFQALFAQKVLEEYSYYVFTSSYDEE